MTGVARLVAALTCALACSELAAEPYRHGRLFRIERPGVAHSYVFGTLHSNDPRVTTLPQVVTDALSRSRTAAFETVLTDRDLGEYFAAAQFDDARKLTDLVDAATIARIREALGNDAPDDAVLAKLKPWAVLLLLGQALGGAPSLDIVLKAEARRRDLAVVGLELADEQVASLDAIPLASQLALMHWALATGSARTADMEATTHAWLAGDLAKLYALARKPGVETPALAPHFDALLRHLIVDRTVVMAHRLHLPLARGRVFVAVGALHLYGRSGLLAVLARNGYRIRRVFRRVGPRHAARYNAHSSLERMQCRTSPICAPSTVVNRSTSATWPPIRSSNSRAGSTRPRPRMSPKSTR